MPIEKGFVLVDSFSHMEDADALTSKLEANGIPAYLANEQVVGVDFFWAQSAGQVQVYVHEKDVARAQKVLKEKGVHSEE